MYKGLENGLGVYCQNNLVSGTTRKYQLDVTPRGDSRRFDRLNIRRNLKYHVMTRKSEKVGNNIA